MKAAKNRLHTAPDLAPFRHMPARKALHRGLKYGLAIALVAAAAAVRLALHSSLGVTMPFVTFYPALVLIVLFWGLGPALVGIVLSGVMAFLLFLGPLSPLKLFLTWTGFCVSGILFAIIARRLEKARAERPRRESEERLSLAQHIAGIGTFEWKVKGGTTWTPELEAMHGLPPGGFAGGLEVWKKLLHPEDREEVMRKIDLSFETGIPTQAEWRIVRPDGDTRWIAGRWQAFKDQSGGLARIVGVNMDITARKRTEDELAQARARLEAHLTNSPMAIIELDSHFRIIRWSGEAPKVFGWSAGEVIGRSLEDIRLIHEDDLDTVRTNLGDLESGARTKLMSVNRNRRKDGTIIHGEWYLSAIYDCEGRLVSILVQGLDVTERVRAGVVLTRAKEDLEKRVALRTEELRQQMMVAEHERDRLMTLIDSMADGVWLTDADGTILLANHMARQQSKELGLDPGSLHGPASAAIMSQIEIAFPDGQPLGLDMIAKILEGEPLRQKEVKVRNKAGGPAFYRRLSANAVKDRENRVAGLVVVVQDMTAQKQAAEEKARLEEQLRQSQKMEALGTLAGGVAHDFNNMLAVVLGNAELALDDLAGSDTPSRNIEQIITAAKRARDLVKQILAFSRKTGREKVLFEPAGLVRETCEMLRGTLPSTVRMEMDVREGVQPLLAAPSEIQQILMNLATNGAFAMRERGGVLTVRLSGVLIDRMEQIGDADLAPGAYVKLTVQDTGAGMTEAVRRRVFEPFFTTKKPGEGTGMGLAVAYGIVKTYDGAITVESTPGKGTVFDVFLPCTRAQQPAGEREKAGETPRGSEHILLVDDEPAVVEMTTLALRRLGYRVTPAGSGNEAWDLFRTSPDAFDLVITDQTMPGLTGIELAGMMMEARKDIPVILFTGYSETVSPEKAKNAGIREFVMKPVARRETAQTIRKVLDTRKSE